MKGSTSVAISVFALLSACGGSSRPNKVAPADTATVSPIQAIPQPAASEPNASWVASTPVINIAVFGDDAAMGVGYSASGMPSRVTPNAADDLQALLRRQFNDSGITVENHASGGTAASIMNLLDGMDGGGPPFAQRIAATKSSIVILSYALNDGYGGETASDFSGYLAQAIQIIRDAKRQPVLEEPGPTCDANHPQLAAYVSAIDITGKTFGVPVIAQYNAVLGLSSWKVHMDASCTFPDAWLDSFKASQEQAVIAQLVKMSIDP